MMDRCDVCGDLLVSETVEWSDRDVQFKCRNCGESWIVSDWYGDDDYDPALIENPPLFCDWGDDDDEGMPHRHESDD